MTITTARSVTQAGFPCAIVRPRDAALMLHRGDVGVPRKAAPFLAIEGEFGRLEKRQTTEGLMGTDRKFSLNLVSFTQMRGARRCRVYRNQC